MPIENIIQPEIINICTELRLRKFDHEYSFALDWYRDKDTVILVDGLEADLYDDDKLKRMYEYLDDNGELYFIEALEGEQFMPIGDVTFSKEDMPIVIGDKRYRGKGVGKKVLETLIKRARELGYQSINVREIYTYNIASQRLFGSVGFEKCGNKEKGFSYILIL